MKEQIEKFQKVEKSLSESKGQFELFALFLREDSPGRWDLLISAEWVRANKKASINTIIEEIRKELSDPELLMLSRIVILDKDDETLKAIHRARRVEHGLAEISDSSFSGLAIKHAYLITSQRQIQNHAAEAKSCPADE
ncbi:hypothetical protein LZ24_03459 [Desulfobotulus alkaliphilus]|uniref:Uncharacterized protein n=1 Tax=Desulfobotulus alkaliphilus TaxID=622671 RepID=A0A562QWS3_9BACT|nr:hypothetical protein [Desulfobotulus alkaliphilus]TWI61249.1 hypothetical protein LZ24_03459 [Desulfobotulus alkaliphilus]